MNYDIVIVGSGVVGLATALAIARKTSLNIALVESSVKLPVWQESAEQDHRVSAISLASKQLFQSINAWDAILAKRLHAFTNMQVFDEAEQGKIHFDCREVNEPALGYIIEDRVLRASLIEQLSQYENIHLLHPVKLTKINHHSDYVELIAADGKVFSAKLLIAADGAQSWVREQVGVELKTKDYEQIAIVATVRTERPHQSTAWQRFLSTGPLAFLPLSDLHTSSIVWSVTSQEAQHLLTLNNTEFLQKLSAAFIHLGQVTATSSRFHFPLRMRHAKNYVLNRVALVGDAAHTIHPLAGQGLNLGLQDAAYLAEVIAAAVNKNRDYSQLYTLRRYERWRKSDNLSMLAVVDLIKYLFTNENALLKTVRNAGINFANRSKTIKNYFIQYALGRRGEELNL